MYHHVKKLMFTVRVDEPDPRFGNMLLEQFGGANGELAAAMQYSIQGLNCEDPERKDLLMDIGTEEQIPLTGSCGLDRPIPRRDRQFPHGHHRAGNSAEFPKNGCHAADAALDRKCVVDQSAG